MKREQKLEQVNLKELTLEGLFNFFLIFSATAVTLNRSGPQVVFRADAPFLLLLRHDPTRLPLFYGAVFEPVNT